MMYINENPFPKHNIDPNLKGKDWILSFAKTAHSEWHYSTASLFRKNLEKYREIKDYVLGQQSINKYKKLLGVEESANDSWLAVDWKVRPIGAKLRSIGISKLVSREYNILCTAIDPMAQTKVDEYFADTRTKIMMFEALKDANPDLAANPLLRKQLGEPEDMEELEITQMYGAKYNLAMESEMGIDLIFYKNGFDKERERNSECLFDYGVGGYKEWIDENQEVKLRSIQVEAMMVSPCQKPDFSDKTYCGEYIEVPLSQLADKFTSEELETIANSIKSNNKGFTPKTAFNDEWDGFKATVLDLEFLSWNEYKYQQRVNLKGNLVVRPEPYSIKTNGNTFNYKGEQLKQYISKKKEVVYKCKWIVGTDLMYDFGLATNMKRSLPNKACTELSYHLYAYNFFRMQASGMMERIIPLIDEYHLTMYKIQNFKNQWMPYIIDIDFDALENVSLGQAGQNMTKKDILDMMFQKFVLVNRKKDISGTNINYKAVDVRPTSMGQEFSLLAADLSRILSDMRDTLGLNEITDGSSPNPNLLNGVARLGAEATNNALRPILLADRHLTESLARGVIQRLTQVVGKKTISGEIPYKGQTRLKFITLSKDISLHDWAIKIEDRPTDYERELLLQQLNLKDANGMIDPEDYVMIMNTKNLKQAAALLAYRTKKRRKENEAYELKKMQMNGQVQQESAVVAEQAKQQTLQLEWQLRRDTGLALKEADKDMLLLKLGVQQEGNQLSLAGKVATTAIQKGVEMGEKDEEESIVD